MELGIFFILLNQETSHDTPGEITKYPGRKAARVPSLVW